jgi:putative ABC transport system ATP-binding protein
VTRGPGARTGAAPQIVLRGLTKTYREGDAERVVFRDVDAEIRAGELVVVLGRSGSGKSTLLNILSGIDAPTCGDVVIGGVRLTALSEHARTLFRRRQLGFVFQFFNLIPTLTAEENVLLPLELNGADDPPRRAAALALLDAVGLGDRRGAFPDRLSGGEQQRIAIARALAHDPLVVLADEPTGNLDVDTGRAVVDILDRLTRRAGKTMIMVTHSAEVVGIADRLWTIQDGRLVESAP